jgi:hypothetical protein
MKFCQTCGNVIPKIRVEIMPHTTTCVGCSTESKRVGFMDWYHKTAPELVVVSADDRENLRRAQRVNSRSR